MSRSCTAGPGRPRPAAPAAPAKSIDVDGPSATTKFALRDAESRRKRAADAIARGPARGASADWHLGSRGRRIRSGAPLCPASCGVSAGQDGMCAGVQGAELDDVLVARMLLRLRPDRSDHGLSHHARRCLLPDPTGSRATHHPLSHVVSRSLRAHDGGVGLVNLSCRLPRPSDHRGRPRPGAGTFSRVIRAQAIRAILFASATVASRAGRRASSPRIHAPTAPFDPAARCTIDVARARGSVGPPVAAFVIRPRRVLPPVEFAAARGRAKPRSAAHSGTCRCCRRPWRR